ncbi:MAG: substrate-binding domain-containing protein [Microthrixaceae bacterium]|nr:substrate-binding domain-containing protein [Microthrixaceae bacterium]
MTTRFGAVALCVVLAAGAVACSSADDAATPDTVDADGLLGQDPGDCIVVDMAVSPEKIDLMTDLAQTFNDSDEATSGDECIFVRPQRKSSGASEQLLRDGWDEAVEGPLPVVWSPASSAWGAVLNQQLTDQGDEPIATEGEPFMLTPLVIAMPEPMAEALGYPQEPVGWADILRLSRGPEGWAAFDHPEWGPFLLGKTNPNFSTSGLSALIAQAYANTGKTEGLTVEDLDQPQVEQAARDVESAVVHYGDTTLTFLNNMYRADQRGNSLTYASAVAVEEKSVIDYNAGNPDGVLDPGEEPRPPRVPLVAIYPEEGTLYSDNPLITLDAEWVTEQERDAAAVFVDFVQQPENQERVLEFGFRPGNPDVAISEPIVTGNGVDPDQPQTLLEVPEPEVMVALLDNWDEQRKGARVVLLMDVSGSMGDIGDPDTGETKLDLAKRAAIDALDDFAAQDIVGLRIFSTDLGPSGTAEFVDVVPVGRRMTDNREALATAIRALAPTNATPLYSATQAAYEDAVAAFDEERINAVVLLSDGVNDDGETGDDDEQLDSLLAALEAGGEGRLTQPVRVFPIAYGEDADLSTLRRIAEASTAAVYDASDPTSIDKVFAAVVSNF